MNIRGLAERLIIEEGMGSVSSDVADMITDIVRAAMVEVYKDASACLIHPNNQGCICMLCTATRHNQESILKRIEELQK